MNIEEFRRRLMTEPDRRDADMRAAGRWDPEFASLARESEAFEAKLKAALELPVPDGLIDRITNKASSQPARRGWLPVSGVWANAAAVVLLVAAAILAQVAFDAPGHAELREHLRWHWNLDGPEALAMAQLPSPQVRDLRVLNRFGLEASEPLAEHIAVSKFCPAPGGTGVHLVLETTAGQVTVFYLPETRLARRLEFGLDDERQARVFNLGQGSVALIAEADIDLEPVAHLLRGELRPYSSREL